MAGYFDFPTADAQKGGQFPAIILHAAIRKTGESSSQFYDLGPLQNAELTITQAKTEAQGKQIIALGAWEVKWKFDVLSTSTAIRSALAKISQVGTDTKLTTIDGKVYTMLYTDNLDCAVLEDRKGSDANTPHKFTIEGGGTISDTVFGAMLA